MLVFLVRQLSTYAERYWCIFVQAVKKYVIIWNEFVVGYLRLKRRYRIMCVIRDLKTARAYIPPSNNVQLQKLQSVSMSHKRTTVFLHTRCCILFNNFKL